MDYVITFTRIGDKQPSTQTAIISATSANIVIPNPAGLTGVTVRAGVNTKKIFKSEPSPAFLPIEILLTRNDVTLLPGDSYYVDISVTDEAGNRATTMYDRRMFTMKDNFIGEGEDVVAVAYDELLVDLDPSADCGTGTDSDGDGVARAYELHIGTDCKGSVDDYIGSTARLQMLRLHLRLRHQMF